MGASGSIFQCMQFLETEREIQREKERQRERERQREFLQHTVYIAIILSVSALVSI